METTKGPVRTGKKKEVMKKLVLWITFFILCTAVIGGAVQAGINDHQCNECLKGVDEKAYENSKFADKCIYNN
jgi:hypothetical protein